MVYLDNAATTFKKPKCVRKSLTEVNCIFGNAGRASHDISERAAETVFKARCKVSRFLGLNKPENVVFTLNATYALNFAIKGLIREPCHVLISDLEHNSVIRPLFKLKEEIGLRYSTFDAKSPDLFSEIESKIQKDTKFLISTLASNVIGKEVSLEILSTIAKKHSIKLIVDASQLIGHKAINLSKTPCDALCAPAHKALFGITGLGFVVFGNSLKLETLIEGGSGFYSRETKMPTELPERMEAGTLPIPAINALSAGIDYISKIGIDEIEYKMNFLTNRAKEMILSVPNVIFYGGELGVISFNLCNHSSESIASMLNEHRICVRAGLHCAPMAHYRIGTRDIGTVRVSFSYLTKSNEIERLYKALKVIERGL